MNREFPLAERKSPPRSSPCVLIRGNSDPSRQAELITDREQIISVGGYSWDHSDDLFGNYRILFPSDDRRPRSENSRFTSKT